MLIIIVNITIKMSYISKLEIKLNFKFTTEIIIANDDHQ